MVTKAYEWDYVKAGANTLNGSSGCFPVNITIAKTFNIGNFETVVVHLKCNDVTTPLTIAVTKSVDGNSFMAVNATFASLDNNEQWVVLGAADDGCNILKVSITNAMVAETATVLAVVGKRA